MDALTAIDTRRSTRKFRAQPIPRQTIETILNAGRMAATAHNEQPWEFIVVQDPNLRKQVAELTDHGQFIANVPICVAVFCHDTNYYIEDGCSAVANILIAAAALGVSSCWVAGARKPYAQKIGRILGVPDDLKIVALVPLGFTAKPDSQRAPKKALPEILHWDKYQA